MVNYVIYASLPENHSLNDKWLLKRSLQQCGFTSVKIARNEPVSFGDDNKTPDEEHSDEHSN